MKRLLLLITICISSVSYGQFNCADTTLVELTYFNSWSIVDITSPILFTDSGGENGNYSNGENYSIIFNSGSSTNTIVVNINETGFEHSTFTAFDILKIYTSTDGVNWISYEDPNFFYHDYSIVPDNIGNGIIPFTLDLGTQYVKFTFYSDPSITKPGWKIILTPQNSSTSPGSETMTECNSYTWNTNGQTYTQSGQYTTVLTNAQGCDSTVTLDLTITQPNTGSETVTGCDSYTWSTNGQTYTQSGQYTEVLTNQSGCDSSVTLDLTITNSNTGSETMTECNSYTWNTNGQTYTQTGQYTTVLTNAQGCDSTVTLDLTITNSNTGTDIQTACDSYTWLDGTTYTSSNNSATWILTNASGCDSTVTLDLTINSSSSSTQTQTGIDSYTWSVNNETYTESGAYTAVIPNAAGCDSTITLDLTLEFVGLNENESYYVAVYPNPTYSSFILTTKDMIHMNYTLVDIQGKVVLTGKIESSEETVDISNLSRGRYNLVFEGESIPVVSVIKQ